jgi:hypothetical protein
MRPPAIEKMGWYPTSINVAELLKTYFAPADSGRLLDPCAGEGLAAAILASALNCASWGAELSPARAALAAERMDRVFNAPWQSCHLTPEAITLLFLNPPYSHNRLGDQKRLELEFLKSTTPKLTRGGALVYIVPHALLRDNDVATHLAGYYEQLTVYRYPDTGFNQVILLGLKRLKYKMPSAEEISEVQAWADIEPPMLVDAAQPVYQLLPASDKGAGGQPVRFTRLDWQPEEIVDASQKRGVQTSKEWLDLLNPERAVGSFKQPVMPLKKGHIAMLMASGMMGTLRLNDEDGKPMLVKGRVVKVTEKVEETESKDGKSVTEIYRDRFVSTVAVVRQSGIEVIDQVDPLAKFMHKYGDQLGAHILSTYRPIYNFDPTPQEIAILDTLGTKRKPLPGQEKAGLLPTQRHVAAAMARTLRKHGVGNLQGEMGAGKSITGAAITDLLDAYPAIVLCPPHLVPKWIREIEETIPGAKAMELVRIGRNANDPGDINDVRRFLELYKDGKLGKKAVAVVANTSAKYGAGWEHAVKKQRLLSRWDGATVKRHILPNEKGEAIEALCCPKCGSPIQIEEAGGVTFTATSIDDLGDKRRFCDALVPGYELNEDGRLKRDEQGNPVWGKRACGEPLFQFTGRRWSIAEYIANHAKEQFKMLVADECLVRDTLIATPDGPRPIQDISVGDYVLSYNHESKQVEARKVLQTMKNPAPEKLIKAAGIVCTPNHPIFTEEQGYVKAQKVSSKTVSLLRNHLHDLPQGRRNSQVLLPLLRVFQPFPRSKKEGGRCTSETAGRKSMRGVWENLLPEAYGATFSGSTLLFPELQIAASTQEPGLQKCLYSQIEGFGRSQITREASTIFCRTDAAKQPHKEPGNRGEDSPSTQGQNFSCTRRQWTTDKTADSFVSRSRFAGSGNGTCHPNCIGEGTIREPAYCLQSGYRHSRCQVSHRSGWQNPQNQEMEISRPPQNGGLEFYRVDRVEILERGSGSGFEQVCPDGFVYNLEVEGNHNYFANGVLVHNCHEFAAKASDRGIAFHQLVSSTKYTLTLTGTFFGGKSSSIFWLLHRLNAGVRKDFAFNDEKRWARLYGVLEMTRQKKRADDDDEDGFTGNRRYQNQAKEKPGISPAIVNRLLDTTVFLSLKDLGLSLPRYSEEVAALMMEEEQGKQYRDMAGELRKLAIKNRRYLSTWLQWTLARPNSAFRDEVVQIDEINRDGEFVRTVDLMELPAVVREDRLPKEQWLVDFCRSERQQGRKVLIYVRQTGTRDIQDRILKVLRDGGVRTEVLSSGINPQKREEWIARRVHALDALITNPRLVATGLDLVAFSSVVFAEVEYSLYTLWQALRRVWRLGQTKPVKAIFSVYHGAMESQALALIGAKMKAAQLLYGDEVGGAIVSEDDGDILMKLAREALEAADLPDLQALFADEVVVSNSPLGCPTATSVPLPVPEAPSVSSWADWMTQRSVAVKAVSRPRAKPAANNQISLF